MPFADPEKKRKADRERIAKKRAGMTRYERAAARAEHDRTYRDKHREERRISERKRLGLES